MIADMPVIQRLAAQVRARRAQALSSLSERIEQACARISIIEPGPAVVARTLRIFQHKLLAPFDEMVLGAVLAKAAEVRATSRYQGHSAATGRTAGVSSRGRFGAMVRMCVVYSVSPVKVMPPIRLPTTVGISFQMK